MCEWVGTDVYEGSIRVFVARCVRAVVIVKGYWLELRLVRVGLG